MMTRRDFNLIATIIRELNMDMTIKRRIIWAFAKGLKVTNPAFDSGRFIAACENSDD